MKLSYFKPSDFDFPDLTYSAVVKIAEIANAKLEREAVKVYGNYANSFSVNAYDGDTTTALVINIQPIKECEHKPMPNTIADLNNIKCSRCGIDLEPTGWRAKK